MEIDRDIEGVLEIDLWRLLETDREMEGVLEID